MEPMILNEERNEDTIIKCYIHIYSHMMKFLKVSNARTGHWITTIYNHISQLQKIRDQYWREFNKDRSAYDSIKEGAINEFISDNSGNSFGTRAIAEKAFTEVSFRIDLEEAKRFYPVKQYLLDIADKDRDYDTLRLIENSRFKNVSIND